MHVSHSVVFLLINFLDALRGIFQVSEVKGALARSVEALLGLTEEIVCLAFWTAPDCDGLRLLLGLREVFWSSSAVLIYILGSTRVFRVLVGCSVVFSPLQQLA